MGGGEGGVPGFPVHPSLIEKVEQGSVTLVGVGGNLFTDIPT